MAAYATHTFERKTEQPQKKEPPAGKAEAFAEPNIAPALRKLREMLANDRVNEEELLAILRESAPRQTLFLKSLDEIPTRTAQLCLQRWATILELVQSMRDDGEHTA